MVAGGTRRNHAFVSETAPVEWGALILDEQLLLCDAQTSGGMLIAVDPASAGTLVAALEDHGTLAAAVVGRVGEGPPGSIVILRG
jgi:selenide,water dikinase